jgi:hypothetical protein
MAFATSYADAAGLDDEHRARLIDGLGERVRLLYHRHASRKLRHFLRRKRPWHVQRDRRQITVIQREAKALSGWGDQWRFFFENEGRELKASRTTHVRAFPNAGGMPFVAKRYRPTRLWHRIGGEWITGSRARRAWEMLNACEIRQIAAPLPVGYVNVREGIAGVDSFVVAQELSGTDPLRHVIARTRGGSPADPTDPWAPAERAVFADEFARTVRFWLWAGFRCRDFKPGNLIVTPGSTPRDVRIAMVDIDGVRFRAGSNAHVWADAARMLGRLVRPALDDGSIPRGLAARFLITLTQPDPLIALPPCPGGWHGLWRATVIASRASRASRDARAAHAAGTASRDLA